MGTDGRRERLPNKKDPGKEPGSFLFEDPKIGDVGVLESEIRQVAVAVSDASIRHQDMVDHCEKAAEPGGGGREGDRSSLGHVISLQ